MSDDENPAMQALMAELEAKKAAGKPIAFTPSFRLAVENATNFDVAAIPVERTQGPILPISGEADDLWPSTELAEIAMQRLRQRKFPFQFTHLRYQDTGHYILYPFLPTTVSEEKDPFDAVIMQYGGTPAGNARAAFDSLNRVLDFFQQTLYRRTE